MTPDLDLKEIIAKYEYNGIDMGILFLDMSKFFRMISQRDESEMVSNLSEAIVRQIRARNKIITKSNSVNLNEFMDESSLDEKVKNIQERISACLSLILEHLSDVCKECEMKHKKCHEIFDAHRDLILVLTTLDLESTAKCSKIRKFLEELIELSWSKNEIPDESIPQTES